MLVIGLKIVTSYQFLHKNELKVTRKRNLDLKCILSGLQCNGYLHEQVPLAVLFLPYIQTQK